VEFQRVVAGRHMVRRFTPRPIPTPVLERVLETGLRGPSAGWAQGLELVVLSESGELDDFWRLTDPRGRKRPAAAEAPPVVILPLSDRAAYLRRYGEPDKRGLGLDEVDAWPLAYWDLDAAMAVMLMLLCAVDEGLGAWFFGLFAGEAELRESLRIPHPLRPIGALALGYPSDEDHPRGSPLTRRRRRLDEVVHHGRWGDPPTRG
jgi:nitroreductase